MHIVHICQPCIAFLQWGMQMEMVQWAGCCTFSVLLPLPTSQLKIPCLFLIRANRTSVWWNTLKVKDHSLKSWRLVHHIFKYQQKYINTVRFSCLDTWKVFKERRQGGVGIHLARLATTICVLPSSSACMFQGIETGSVLLLLLTFFPVGHAAVLVCWRCGSQSHWRESYVPSWPSLESTAWSSGMWQNISCWADEIRSHIQVMYNFYCKLNVVLLI